MSFGRKRNMSKSIRKNTPGTGKRGRLTDQDGLGRTTTDHGGLHTDCIIFRTEKISETKRE